MTQPRLEYVTCADPAGVHRMAYWEWGNPDNDRVLICAHGLTRTGRDFDELAQRMAPHYRVVCPDVAGRGRSDWLINPAAYVVPQYAADMLVLIARLKPRRLAWLGTSMGGLIGLALAGMLALSAQQRPGPLVQGLPAGDTLRLDRMVLNDIGPNLDPAGLGRIAEYVGQPAQFDTLEQAAAYVQSVSEGFGPHTPEQWLRLTRDVFVQQGGHWVKHYDLRLALPMAQQDAAALQLAEQLLWGAYQSMDWPVLLLRGAQSDLLTPPTAQRMLALNARARMVEFEGVGHAPTLLSDEQQAPIEQFLLADAA